MFSLSVCKTKVKAQSTATESHAAMAADSSTELVAFVSLGSISCDNNKLTVWSGLGKKAMVSYLRTCLPDVCYKTLGLTVMAKLT